MEEQIAKLGVAIHASSLFFTTHNTLCVLMTPNPNTVIPHGNDNLPGLFIQVL